MNLLNWNTEWARPDSSRGQRVAAQLASHDFSIACLTEAYPEILPANGNTITSSDNSGYRNEGGRRKVVMWSRDSWSEVWQAEESQLPGGRFVSGVTAGFRIVGLCIPWSMAHVTSGARNRAAWEDHLAFTESLRPILADLQGRPEPLIVTGDWNQRLPRTRQPLPVYESLNQAISGLILVTEGTLPEVGEPLIDHLALSPSLNASAMHLLPRQDRDGARLSDHLGYSVEIEKSRVS